MQIKRYHKQGSDNYSFAIWSRRLKPFRWILQPCRRQTNWACFSWASALLSSCALSLLLPASLAKQLMSLQQESRLTFKPNLNRFTLELKKALFLGKHHTVLESNVCSMKETNLQAQRAKGCHISWKWSLPLLPENLKKSFQFNSNLLPNRIGPRKTCRWRAPHTSFTPPPAVWGQLQTLQRVADEPAGQQEEQDVADDEVLLGPQLKSTG